jgi:hypothetical protein
LDQVVDMDMEDMEVCVDYKDLYRADKENMA